MAKTIRVVKNSDNDALLPLLDKRVAVGCVDEVNGKGAVEVDAYVPTRHEVEQLVKYWHRRALENSWFFFIYGGTGSSEVRLKAFARRRIERAQAAIGKEAVDAAIKEVRDEFRTKVVKDDRLWDIFENGTQEQWDAVLDETWREWCEQDAAEALKRLEQMGKEFPGDFVALVLRDWPDDKGRPVLISPTTSELNAVLRASGTFEIGADVSRVRALIVDQHFTSMGFLRARRRNGEWLFEFPGSSPGTIGWHFLEAVTSEVKKRLHASSVEDSGLPSLA